MAENIDVFDFELTPAEMASIDQMNINERTGPDPETFDVEAFRALIAASSGS